VNLIRRGDIYRVNLEPTRDSEAGEVRPCVVVTNNIANQENPILVILPLTSNIERIYPFQVLLPLERTGLEKDSKVQVEQIRALSVRRFGERLGFVPEDLMAKIDERIKLHLALP